MVNDNIDVDGDNMIMATYYDDPLISLIDV